MSFSLALLSIKNLPHFTKFSLSLPCHLPSTFSLIYSAHCPPLSLSPPFLNLFFLISFLHEGKQGIEKELWESGGWCAAVLVQINGGETGRFMEMEVAHSFVCRFEVAVRFFWRPTGDRCRISHLALPIWTCTIGPFSIYQFARDGQKYFSDSFSLLRICSWNYVKKKKKELLNPFHIGKIYSQTTT